MAGTNFMASANKELKSFNNVYTNARYAPVGNQTTGQPFPAYKEFGGRFTDWKSSGLKESTWKKEFNLPTNTNFFRTSLEQDALNLGNDENNAWVSRTQTLSNLGATLGCRNNSDCEAWTGTTCSGQYENWPEAHGNQSGGYCAKTFYPELGNGIGPSGGGSYKRKLANEGGIGRACSSDSECGQGYSCNNEYDSFGSNLQQTGYCAQKFTCPDGKSHFLGTPWNSGIPESPPPEQNMNGQGYASKEVCNNHALPQQDCVKSGSGKWFAVYPAYCGVPTDLREGNKAFGNVRTTSPNNEKQGFRLPAYATNNSSNMGSKVQAFTTWNIPSGTEDGSTEALKYSMNMNPIPKNLY
jgi:hypothetical protein